MNNYFNFFIDFDSTWSDIYNNFVQYIDTLRRIEQLLQGVIGMSVCNPLGSPVLLLLYEDMYMYKYLYE